MITIIPILAALAGFTYNAAEDLPDEAIDRGGALMVNTALPATQCVVALKFNGELIRPCGEINLRLEGEFGEQHSITGACVLLQVRPGKHGAFQKSENLVKLPAEIVGSIPEVGRGTMRLRVKTRDVISKVGEAFPLKLQGIRLLRRSAVVQSNYYLQKIVCERGGAVVNFAAGDDELLIADLGKRAKRAPHFTIANGDEGGAVRKVRFIGRAVSSPGDREIARFDTERALRGGESFDLELPRPTSAGVVNIDYTLFDDSADGYAVTNHLSYAAMVPTGGDSVYPPNEFLFSCLAHFGTYNMNERRRMISYLERMGANHTRCDADSYWNSFEPQHAGEWKGFKRFRSTIQHCIDAHVEPHVAISCEPKWALQTSGEFKGMPNEAETERFAREFAAKMKGAIRYFEGRNEPNLARNSWSNGVWLARHERAIYKGIHAGNPEAKYLSGEWGGFNRWPENYYDELNREHFDIWAHHYHGEFPSAQNVVGHINEIRRRTGMTKPWMGDECATCDTNSVRAAGTMFKKYMHAWMNGAIGMTWYNLRGKGSVYPIPQGEMSYGLLSFDFSPKPTYVAFNAMTGLYRGAKCHGENDLGTLVMGALMTRESDDAALYPMWVQSAKCSSVTLKAKCDATAAEVVDLFGNISPLKVENGELVFTVTKSPQTVRLHPQKARLTKISEVKREEIAGYDRAVIGPNNNKASFKAESLEYYTQVAPVCGENDDLVWRGRRDCSGSLVVYDSAANLHLLVIAIDDIHHAGDGVEMMVALPDQEGTWEFAVNKVGEDGKAAQCRVMKAPKGFNAAEVAKKIHATAKRSGSMRDGLNVFYDVYIPLAALKTDRKKLIKKGIRLNAIINDNDGRMLEGYMSFVEGDARDTSNWLTVEFEPPYIPEPKPAKSPIEITALYYPGTEHMAEWDMVAETQPERRPLLGWYDEGDPENIDWQIKWAVEHGISSFCVCWYWNRGVRRLEHWTKAFYQAKFRKHLKWFMMYANHNDSMAHSTADQESVTRYWIDNYFKTPEYYTIDGKPVVVIWFTDAIDRDFIAEAAARGEKLSSGEGVKRAFAITDRMVKAAGLKGVCWINMYHGDYDTKKVEYAKAIGCNAQMIYSFDNVAWDFAPEFRAPTDTKLRFGYELVVSAAKKWWEVSCADRELPFWPVVPTGWDARPRYFQKSSVITGRTPEKFGQMCAECKAFCERRGVKHVVIAPINEWQEGSYIEPCEEYGFGMYDALRDAFCDKPNGGWPKNLTPADIGRAKHEYAPMQYSAVQKWTFDKSTEGWYRQPYGCSITRNVDGALHFMTSMAYNFQIRQRMIPFAASKYGQMKLRMKVALSKGDEQSEKTRPSKPRMCLKWGTTENPIIKKDLTVDFEYATSSEAVIADGQWHEYTLKLNGTSAWCGEVNELWFEAINAVHATVDIDWMEFTK